MLYALLATIGTLAILASIAAKFVKLPTDETARDADRDALDDLVPLMSARPGASACHRDRRRAGRGGRTRCVGARPAR